MTLKEFSQWLAGYCEADGKDVQLVAKRFQQIDGQLYGDRLGHAVDAGQITPNTTGYADTGPGRFDRAYGAIQGRVGNT